MTTASKGGDSPCIKPTHKAIKAYYAALEAFVDQNVEHEMAVRSAFQTLLADLGRSVKWTLIPEQSDTVDGKSIRPDGTFRDDYYIDRGYWEAKDSKDKLESEVKKKSARGYPLTNTIFEDTRQAFLYQNNGLALKVDLTDPNQLAELLNAFFTFAEDGEGVGQELRQRGNERLGKATQIAVAFFNAQG